MYEERWKWAESGPVRVGQERASCVCRDPLREVNARCPHHGHSPDPDLLDPLACQRCPDCGKVPGKWQPAVGGRRSELTLEECRTCGAAWTGHIGARG